MAGGAQLRVDYDNLSQLDRRLTRIVDTMSNESDNMSALAGAVGDSRLADRLIEFGNGWKIHRDQIRENLEWLRDSVRQIHTEFENTDAELAAGVEG
jgi:uncharacterized protein YukE